MTRAHPVRALGQRLPETWQERVRPAYRRYRAFVGPPAARRDYRDMIHLEMLLGWALRRESNCIDVGAHVGAVLGRCVSLAPDGEHIAFEPLPALAARLAKSFPTVKVIEAAVYDGVEAAIPYRHFVSDPALSGLTNRPPPPSDESEVIEVAQTTIDASVPDGYQVDLLKIDVEGAELGVLRGAKATLARSDPVVVVEFGRSGARYYGARPEDLFELLDETGLRLFDIDGEGPYTLARLTRRWEDGALWNFVAHR